MAQVFWITQEIYEDCHHFVQHHYDLIWQVTWNDFCSDSLMGSAHNDLSFVGQGFFYFFVFLGYEILIGNKIVFFERNVFNVIEVVWDMV